MVENSGQYRKELRILRRCIYRKPGCTCFDNDYETNNKSRCGNTI